MEFFFNGSVTKTLVLVTTLHDDMFQLGENMHP